MVLWHLTLHLALVFMGKLQQVWRSKRDLNDL